MRPYILCYGTGAVEHEGYGESEGKGVGGPHGAVRFFLTYWILFQRRLRSSTHDIASKRKAPRFLLDTVVTSVNLSSVQSVIRLPGGRQVMARRSVYLGDTLVEP